MCVCEDADAGNVYVMQGEAYATGGSVTISTTLGSCIAVCLWSASLRVGGMNHFVLPSSRGRRSQPGRYGDLAIDRLVRAMVRLGCRPDTLVAKVFGGGTTARGEPAGPTVGDLNTAAALSILRERGIPVVAQCTGRDSGMAVRMQAATGDVTIRYFAKERPIPAVGD